MNLTIPLRVANPNFSNANFTSVGKFRYINNSFLCLNEIFLYVNILTFSRDRSVISDVTSWPRIKYRVPNSGKENRSAVA